MARTTNEFGGGEIVPAIEAITGIQAPVMADFVAVPFGTVLHEHGERRQIQNQINNLKGSSGIERIMFNGIDELDTEQGPNGETVYALNTGDSRVRFYGRVSVVTAASGTQVSLATSSIDGILEVTFFGTGFNLLTSSTTTANLTVSRNGNTVTLPAFTTANDLDSQNIRANKIFPIFKGQSAIVQTVRITCGDTTGIYGCEIINENAAITQQPGADFDGRVELLNPSSFPIAPDNTTVSSLNSRTGVSEAFTGTTGARVLNYLTSGGQLKQSFDIADEAPVVLVAGEQVYNIQIENGGSSSVTLPTTAANFSLNAYGAGGGGGGGTSSNIFVNVAASGGGGGGGGQAQATFTRAASTQAETLALSIPGSAGGGAGNIFASGAGGTNGGNTTVTVGGTQIAFGGGAAGGGGAPVTSGGTFAGGGGAGGGTSTATFTGWNISAAGGASGAGGSNGSVTSGAGTSNLNLAGGAGGSVGGFGNSPLTGSEGQGGAPRTNNSNAGDQPGGSGQTPGGGAAGGGSDANGSGGTGSTGGAGAAGRIYLEIVAGAGLSNTDFGVATGEFTAGATTGADVGSTTAIFGNLTFDTNRLNQEVIRRINFREFGANNQFAGTFPTSPTFTLEDGTTNLHASNPTVGTADFLSLGNNGSNRTVTFTFVGTGLDVFWHFEGTGTQNVDVRIDGFAVGSIGTTLDITDNFLGVLPIVSGLSYGTHTVQFNNGAALASNQGPSDFIIYGPKKPEIPILDVGSLELSDYNIMADHVDTPSSGDTNLGKGVLRKIPNREVLVDGTWALDAAVPAALGGIELQSATAAANLNYTFYGTGLEFRFRFDAGTILEFEIDGVLRTLAAADFVGANTITIGTSGSGTANARVTKNAGGNSNDNTAYIIDDLTLGVHTFKVTRFTAAGNFFVRGLDIITPIHINEDNLKVGSLGLQDLRLDPIVEEDEAVVLANLGEAKAWIDCMPTGSPRATHNIAAVIRRGTGQFTIYFDKPFKSGDYVVIGTSSSSARTFAIEGVGNKRANSVNIVITRNDGANLDESFWAAFFGELIDE